MINLYHMNCMELMLNKPDNAYDLAIVDPPYGIGANMQGSRPMGQMMKNKEWNNEVPDERFFNELMRVSRNQIIWGANYYSQHLPPSRCWVVWDKKQPEKCRFSMNELAYTSFKTTPLTFYSVPDRKDRIHPCQKPVSLYKWLLHHYAEKGNKILDTHLGSGSIAIACSDYGFDLDACEIDFDYLSSARERLMRHEAQYKLFA